MASKLEDSAKHIDELARSLAAVLESLAGQGLIDATVEAILKHRDLTDRADEAYQALAAVESSGETDLAALKKAYSDAMLNNLAQIAVVAALTDKLGYIPEIPGSAGPKA